MRIKKVHWLAICLLCVVMAFSAISCADEMPEQQPNGEEIQQEIEWTEPDFVDQTIYQPSTIHSESRFIRNFPGMLIVSNQDYGLLLHYVNKATGEQRVFCFDPLCDHDNCIARQVCLAQKIIYHPHDGNIYGYLGAGGRMGTEIYRIDMETQEAEVIWKGNGNKLDEQVFTYREYLYFAVYAVDGGVDIMRYDVETEQVELLNPPQGRKFRFFIICGETILVRFMDDPTYYLANDRLQILKPIEDVAVSQYMSEKTLISYIMGDQAVRGTALGNIIGYQAYDFKTSSVKTFYESDVPMYPKGFDGEYVYYTEYEVKADNTVRELDTLYRVSCVDGHVDEVLEKGGQGIQELHCFEGVLYYYRKQYTDGSADLLYGKLVKTENGFVAEDFEIEHP